MPKTCRVGRLTAQAVWKRKHDHFGFNDLRNTRPTKADIVSCVDIYTAFSITVRLNGVGLRVVPKAFLVRQVEIGEVRYGDLNDVIIVRQQLLMQMHSLYHCQQY
jgi:hypothetical protein